MVLRNAVHKDLYADSVALMRVAARLAEPPGVETVSLVMGTPANQDVLARSGLLTDPGRTAGPNDLLVAVRGAPDAVDAALAQVVEALTATDEGPDAGAAAGATAGPAVRSLVGAPADASLALISTPGPYAAAEALKALRLGMHAFVFSDHVPVEDEVSLKREAARRGLLVMGPDCGTAVISGIPLGFANEVRAGSVGLVGASGTGLQQVSSLLHARGAGVSHLIGTGSRDVSADVGGMTMRAGLDALAADPATEVIVLVSKPPAPQVAERLLRHAGTLSKPVVACFLGTEESAAAPAGITLAPTLSEAARCAASLAVGGPVPDEELPEVPTPAAPRRLLRALYAGGTFAHEAAFLLGPVLGDIARTAPPPIPGAVPSLPDGHLVLDLGDDEFTAGRPHPMIDPTVRTAYLRAALADPSCAAVVLDVVIGHGAARDPAGALARALAEAPADAPPVIAFVVGTDADPQGLTAQQRILRDAGAYVVDSSTTAARVCAGLLAGGDELVLTPAASRIGDTA
ncbi:acyl-CoA synthetase FdrA [Streptomyces antnestii]|uniref:Acyl-CoA synthetase FdrA n=1 Tax=Streptomyces antnestii TaxID=2494256 RepID=A0A437PJG8_9ACTN|nr:acyl-CoA synthetase FdrA [Streptomyces sp. San01]RVU22395.1 acyl-CoA synthetase FdrA [Streptomyces sp. San01]